jgi:predicted N-acyltransferase
LPAEVHSLHWIRDPRLRLAVSDFLQREASTTRRHIAQLAEHGPFHREE